MLPLVDILSREVIVFGLVFCRIGAAMMVLPVFGERYVLSRARLWLALAVSLVITAVVPPAIGNTTEPTSIAAIVATELVVGLFIGATVRLLLAVSHLAGGIIAMQSGLASAAFFDPAEGTQGSGIGNFLTMLILVLLLVGDGHHMMLQGLSASYRVIPSGELPVADMSEVFTRMSTLAFEVSLRIAAPLLLAGILLNVVSGVMNRLMPSFQVMFVIMPLQIAMAFAVLMLSLYVTADLAMEYFHTSLRWLDAP